jgi:hypothetical protein
MNRLAHLLRRNDGSTVAEFALVLPLLIFFLLGIIDVGRLMWTWNRAEKATQMGARFAVVTTMIPSTLASRDFALADGIPGGDPVPSGTFATTTCDNANCSGSWGYNGTAFTNVVTRMRNFYPQLAAANITVRYDNVGLGYAGDPNGPDVAPLVTVQLRNMTFTPLLFQLFGTSLTLPPFSAALTMEDADGSVAN